ncbi:Coiled-coil domain-containing protein 47-like protein, partial [Leptotrombidium deliense]
ICLVNAILLQSRAFKVNAASKGNVEVYEDNEFAEFEEFDEEEDVSSKKTKTGSSNQLREETSIPQQNEVTREEETDAVVEDEEEYDEFDNLKDSEEFELDGESEVPIKKGPAKTGDLKITKVPLHLRSGWESYYLEFLMIAGLVVYFLNFITGRNKNQRLANAWLNAHRELLESNFTLVGDDGKKEIENHGLVKETENIFTLWCSGRVCVEGMLVELKFLKRQDLVNTISTLIKPAIDQI